MYFFVLSFHDTKLIVWACNIPKLAEFMESLTQEQDKLVIMGTIKPCKDQYLVARYLNVDLERKKKAKNPPKQKRDKSKSQEDPSSSKKNF